MRKGEFSKMVITKELYKKFLREFPEYKDMQWEDFFNHWMAIASKIRHEAIWNPLGIKLGSHTGEIKLQYLPYKLKAMDYHSSEQIGEKTTFLNLTERGKVPKIKWERRWAVKFNKILQFYAFDETRDLNKIAHDYIQKHPDRLRTARVTLGGVSVWRQKFKKK